MDVRKLLALGTGVGIEIGRSDLRVVMARVRPAGIAVAGSATIAGFRGRPAAEWGLEYADFLNKLGGGHLAATVLLPRREVIVRQVSLPGVSDRDLAQAMQYQSDSLHPFGEDEAHYAWARLPGTSTVLVGIARRDVIERYAALFAEAGVKASSFTFSAAVVYSAVRILSSPPEEFLAAVNGDGETEIYGESPARPLLSAVVDSPRAMAMAASELRLSPEAQPCGLLDVLPAPKSAPTDYDFSRAALAYATALAGACPRLALAANLLPAEMRSASSRAMFVPTAALAGVLLVLLGALAVQARLTDNRYLAALQEEIARIEPQATSAAETERSVEETLARIRLLDDFRGRTRADLEALNGLTSLLAPPAWLTALELTRDSLSLAGEAEQAAALLKILDGSSMFRNSEFQIPIARAGRMEMFRIRAAREGAR